MHYINWPYLLTKRLQTMKVVHNSPPVRRCLHPMYCAYICARMSASWQFQRDFQQQTSLRPSQWGADSNASEFHIQTSDCWWPVNKKSSKFILPTAKKCWDNLYSLDYITAFSSSEETNWRNLDENTQAAFKPSFVLGYRHQIEDDANYFMKV